MSVTTLLIIRGRYEYTFACRHASAPRSARQHTPPGFGYYTYKPDASIPEQQVAFDTSGHRGSSLQTLFNEDHILAICQAIAEWRRTQRITGPLYLGMDTHALSEPALATAIEVFAANAVDIFVQSDLGYTPTPAVSHAILTYNHGRASGLADGVVITPSHNPPDDGGFKYNPPSGGRASRHLDHRTDPGSCQPGSARRDAGGSPHTLCASAYGRHDPHVRLCRALRGRPPPRG